MALFDTTIGAALAGSFKSVFLEASSSSLKLGELIDQTNAKLGVASNLIKYQDQLVRLNKGQLLTGLSSIGMELAVEECQKKFKRASTEADQYAIQVGNVVAQQQTLRAESFQLKKQLAISTFIEPGMEKIKGGLQQCKSGVDKIGVGFGKLKQSLPMVQTLLSPIAAVGKMAWDFEDQMSRVRTVTNASDEDFKNLTETARQLGRDTSFSSLEIGEGMVRLGQEGFKASEIISAMPAVLDMAAAGGLKVGETSEIAASTLKNFGLNTSEMGRVGDVLTRTFTLSNSSFNDLSQSMKEVAPLSRKMNISLEETSAVLGVLHDSGLKGSQAGNFLKNMYTGLSDSSSESAEAIAALGIETLDASGNLLPIGEIIKNFSNELSNLEGNSETENYLKKLFGEDALDGADALFGKDSVAKLGQFTAELNNCAGAAQMVAMVNLDTTTGSYAKLCSVISDIGITLGNTLLPALKLLFNISSSIFIWVGLALNTIPGLAEVITVVAGGILFLVSVMAIWEGVILVAAGAMEVLNLVILLNPFMLIGLALIAVALIIFNYWKPISDFFIGLWNSIASGAQVVWTFIKPFVMFAWTIFKIFTPLGWAISLVIGLVQLVIHYWDSIMGMLAKAWEWVVFFFMWGSPIGWIIQLFGYLYNIVSSNWEVIQAFCSGFYQKFIEISDLLGSFFETLFDVSTIGMFFTFFTEGIDGVMKKFEKLGEIWKGIKGYFGFGSDESEVSVQNSAETLNARAESALETAQSSTPAAIAAKNAETPTQVQNNQSYTIVQRPNEDPEELARRITRIQNEQEAADLRGGFSDYDFA